MPAKKTLPKAVKNLNKIWAKRKVEKKFTQVQAAKSLGWSQGAISQYLNNHSNLGPAAVTKFANFLGVDPLEIDPSISGFLPNTRTRIAKYDASNLTTPVNRAFYDTNPPSAFWVRIDGESWTDLTGDQQRAVGGAPWHIRVCPVKDFPHARLYIVQLKGNKEAKLYRSEALPKENLISKKYSILDIDINLSQTEGK
jgi:transcriptional regulator with XRE-family HTH domain